MMTNMKFSEKEVLDLANLARVALTPEEIAKYQTEIPSILEYVGKLSAVPTTDVSPMTGGVSNYSELRPDEIRASDEATKTSVINSFPDRLGNLLKVKAIFSTREKK